MEKIIELSKDFKKKLRSLQFITTIGKFDEIKGPELVYSHVPIENKTFVEKLIRDAIDIENKFVIIDYNQIFIQVCKLSIEDETARGGYQLFAVILIRSSGYPLIPKSHFEIIIERFLKIGYESIINQDMKQFEKFSEEINKMYKDKKVILPIESIFKEIRTGLNTIQGYCELMLESMESDISIKEKYKNYLQKMLDSCAVITNTLDSKINDLI